MASYIWFVRGEQHANLCRTSIESVKRVDPDADCIVMTDHYLPVHKMPGISIMHCDSRGMPMMLANLEAQITAYFLSTHNELVFLDTDILLLKKLPHLGELTVTWRDHVLVGDEGEKIEGIASTMPYNYGVITALHGKRSAEAFIWMRERIRKMHARQQEWYGNQLALAELAGPRPDAGMRVDERQIPWLLINQGCSINIGKIPCELYNYTPRKEGESIADRYALHFKGQARGLMEWYARSLALEWYQ